MFDIEEIRNPAGEKLDAAFDPGDGKSRDIVVIGHGVTGNKDRPWAQTLAETLTDAGLASLRISFAGNGASEGRFEDSTISKELDDLCAVLDVLDDWRITYAGHSMGGAVGVLAATNDPRIQFLISLAGMVHTKDFAARKFGAQIPGSSCMWEKPECPLSQIYMDDMRSIGSVVELASKISVPWLLLHGSADTVVPMQDSIDIIQDAGKQAELRILPGVDHVFSTSAELMAAHASSWLSTRLAD